MSPALALGQSVAAQFDAVNRQDPLPADPLGQQLCKIFGNYLYRSIYADAPQDATKKPQWHTQKRYKLRSRVLFRDWQDAEKLIGVRPGHETAYALLDIDINSPYHPRQDASAIARIEVALETIGITRTLRIRSSWSEGLHLYLPLPEFVKTFNLAVALKNCLEPQGFKLKQGHLECFPNVKAYGNIIKTEYLAHRLPLQPGSGSCLLDESFSPASNELDEFLSLWDIAATGQDISTLRQALPLARKNRYKKVCSRLNKVDSWKKDLETLIEEGWTGPSQTNQLLKEFGCYGHVFLGYCGEELVDFIYQQAIASPGYQQWCRHQREIKLRSRVWATAIEKYYWPLGSYGKARQAAANDTVAFNDLRAQSAQESIRAAVQQLELTSGLPQQATARAKAIRTTQASLGSTSSSLETLYKADNKKLWHPDCHLPNGYPIEQSLEEINVLPVIPSPPDALCDPEVSQASQPGQLEPYKDKELRTEEEIMKCVGYEHDALASSKTKFYSGRGVRGEFSSFPQPQPEKTSSNSIAGVDEKPALYRDIRENAKRSSTSRKPPKKPKLKNATNSATSTSSYQTSPCRRRKGISRAVADTIAATQSVVQRLGWSTNQVRALIAKKFQGRRRSQLSDEEVLELLYHLQVQYLETEKSTKESNLPLPLG